MKYTVLWFGACFVWNIIYSGEAAGAYFGKSLGKLSEFHHGVSGHVYAVDGRTLFIKDFTYDGEGPAAFFYVGNSKAPTNNGAIRLRDEKGSAGVLKRYRKKDITLSLPEGKTFHSIRWFSVWCDEFSVNFGDVKIPKNLDYPKPQKISGLSGVHEVSSDPIVIVDAQTLLIPNFSYDGEAPDAKFWVGRGSKPSSQGIRIPDENGKTSPLRKYDHKTIVLTLPQDLTVFDMGHFGVWCEAFTVDFGHIQIPEVTNVPPSLKMLGVSPQSKLNCEVLYDDLAFEVRWAVAGESVVVQLVAKLEDGEYMSFGLSGDEDHSQMVGSDVTVAWVDKTTLKGFAYDYYLDAKSQCAGTRGSCPDERLAEKTNSVRLLNAAMVNGYSIVTYQRPLRAADELDRAVKSDKPQPIVWAVGPLNSLQEVSYHTHFLKSDQFLDFGRTPAWNCPMPEMDDNVMEDFKPPASRKPTKNKNSNQFLTETSGVSDAGNRGASKFDSDDYESEVGEAAHLKDQTRRTSRPIPTPKPAPKSNAWEIPPINCDEPEDGVFFAQMGPTGGKQGYPAITGHVGWGISWYINGLLIPEINVVRGKSYTFVVEGGFNPEIPARYHPFYITDDPVGGYEHRSPEERSNIQIFAGVRQSRNGDVVPTGVGRLCNWTPDINGDPADAYNSFGAYQRSLTLQCDAGEPGVVTWTPDRNTPDTVYYQCFTHRYLGWKINVLDSCEVGEESHKHEVYEKFDEEDSDGEKTREDLDLRPSIRVNTRVKPDNNLLSNQPKDLDNHNVSVSSDSHVIIREISKEPQDDIITGKINGIPNLNFDSKVKKVSPENNPRPNIDFPLSKSQFKQVLDSVERYESNMHNSQEEILDRHPIYYHAAPGNHFQQPSAKHDGMNQQDRPLRPDDFKNMPSHMVMGNNQKPMTLQAFLRPHNRQTMMNTNIMYKRPMPGDMRLRRPGKPPRLPPPAFMNQQFMNMNLQKKNFYKMPPGMNRQPMPNLGRPLMLPPMKHPANNGNIMGKPQFVPSSTKSPPQSVIMGKPNLMSQTLTLGQPTIIGQQIIKGQIPNHSGPDNIIQQTITNTFLNKPGQIIMGKPMDNPLPLDQQMIPTKQQNHYTPVHRPMNNIIPKVQNHKFENVKPVYEEEATSKAPDVLIITPSQQMNTPSSTLNPIEELISLNPAVNTGFKPETVVIESGFKPIIREPLLSGQDRITDYDSESVTNNRRHDEEPKEPEQAEESINKLLNNEFYEKQFTESFEPIFIPSPMDRFQSNGNMNHSNGNKLQYVDTRPRPVYVKPSDDDFEKDSEKSDKKPMDDMTMAADRVDAYYLPPDQSNSPLKTTDIKLPVGTVVSYDGQTLSDSTLTSSIAKNPNNKIYSAKLSSNSKHLINTPQFGPFRGEIPSLLQEQLNSENKLKTMTNSHGLPGNLDKSYQSDNKGASKTTKLTLVSSLHKDDDDDTSAKDIEYEASEVNEEFVEADGRDDEETERRIKRSPHHTPDHTESNDIKNETDHSHHDHDHAHHSHTANGSSRFGVTFILPVLVLSALFV